MFPTITAVKGHLTRIMEGLRNSGFDVVIRRDGHAKAYKYDIRTNDNFAPFVASAKPPSVEPF